MRTLILFSGKLLTLIISRDCQLSGSVYGHGWIQIKPVLAVMNQLQKVE
jgi:hypothetical protein